VNRRQDVSETGEMGGKAKPARRAGLARRTYAALEAAFSNSS
jgi:hypothetical protein